MLKERKSIAAMTAKGALVLKGAARSRKRRIVLMKERWTVDGWPLMRKRKGDQTRMKDKIFRL